MSYTDDTSLDSRTTDGFKVSIHADVIRERPLDWYFELLRMFPDILSELKSTTVLNSYFALDRFLRAKVNASLRFVRLNITDPRPYAGETRQALKKILPNEDPDAFLRRLEYENRGLAQRLRRDEARNIARRMLYDSPEHRLRMWIKAYRGSFTFLGDLEGGSPVIDNIDVEPFHDKKLGRVSVARVSVFASKSSAVFIPAIDDLHENPFQVNLPIGPRGVHQRLADRYAFDAGNDKALEWIAARRDSVLRDTDPYSYLHKHFNQAPLESVDSHQSYLVQAADIAAGIARSIIERHSLRRVAAVFDYVTYNGRRINEDEAAEIERTMAP